MTGVWYGVAFGLMAVGAIGGSLRVLHISPDWLALLGLFGFCVGVGRFAEGTIEYVRLWNNDRLSEADRRLAQREREQAMARTAALTPARLTRLVPVNGGQRYIEMQTERPARWVAWQRLSEELLVWYLETGALTVEALVGRGTRKAFSDRTAWSEALAEWHRLGWARKENGVPTVLLRTPDELRAALVRGDVEWTLDADPPTIRPCPSSGEVLVSAPTAERLAKA